MKNYLILFYDETDGIEIIDSKEIIYSSQYEDAVELIKKTKFEEKEQKLLHFMFGMDYITVTDSIKGTKIAEIYKIEQ